MSRAKADAPAPEVERLLPEDDAAFGELAPERSNAPDALARLAAARSRGRLAHAILLAGPLGSGKRWVAVRLAQLLACASPKDGLPCLSCPECLRTERGLDTDVLLLQPPWDEKKGERKGEIPVEQVRKTQELLSFRTEGRRRVVIIDPADRLSIVGQEALLKTLEEPPAGVTILLLTARASFLKPTIRSRAPLLRVQAPSPEALAELLARRKGLSTADAELAARLSGGHVRRALSLDPAEVSETWVGLARTLYEIVGPKGERRARDLALEVAPSKEEGGGREDVAAFLSLLQRILRDVLVAGSAEGDAALLNPSASKAARALAQRLPPDAAAEALALVEQARDDLALNMSVKVLLSHLLLSVHGLRAA